jgi:hypothetical protein
VILFHTWGDDEVLFRDMETRKATRKIGYPKVELAAAQARVDGYDYVWIDNCCIDKSNITELSEAINSIYRWYQHARICYAYLADVLNDQPREGVPGQQMVHAWMDIAGATSSVPCSLRPDASRIRLSKLYRSQIAGLDGSGDGH